MKNNKGITLIALVVTIIVLLILAGVSIAMLSGDNGILTNAQLARDNSAAGTLDEATKIAIGNIMTANLGWPVDDTNTAGTDEGVTITGTGTTAAEKSKDLKTQIQTVNSNITPTITPGTTAWAVTATIDGKVQTVYVTKATGAVSSTNPDATP
ncbi:MAG: hypothetical protein J5507_07135 [Clostridia bacterium]|nr:hypothetical protein [Clostridia bacterium]